MLMHPFEVMNDQNENVRMLIVFVIIIPFSFVLQSDQYHLYWDWNIQALPYYLCTFLADTIL